MSTKNQPREKATIKIIILGCANVGKTSIMQRFATGKFSGVRRPTVGADFLTKKMDIHDVDVNLQVWDTAGQERFHQGTLGSSFYRGSHGALLVYDVNNEKSIEQIAMWREECIQRSDNQAFFPIVVIGNKIDLRESVPEMERVDQSVILSWCRELSYGHIETSAKDGHGVDAAMMAITALALESQRAAPKMPRNSSVNQETVKLSTLYDKKKNGYCEGCY